MTSTHIRHHLPIVAERDKKVWGNRHQIYTKFEHHKFNFTLT